MFAFFCATHHPPVITIAVLRGVPTLRAHSAHTHRPGAHGLLEVPLHLPSPAKLYQRCIRIKIRQVAALHSSLALSPTYTATCKPCPMVLVPDSTVHCSRPPARNLHLSSSDSATCKPCPMVRVPDSTVHCSRPPARNLHISCGTSDGLALGRWGRSTVWCGCSS